MKNNYFKDATTHYYKDKKGTKHSITHEKGQQSTDVDGIELYNSLYKIFLKNDIKGE